MTYIGSLLSEDFVFPDDVNAALTGRKDIFRVLAPENPLLQACYLLNEIGLLVEEYNTLIEQQLYRLGFNQMPTIEGLSAVHRSKAGAMFNLRMEYVRIRTAKIGKSGERRRSKIKASIADRLGYEPEEWVCVYCHGVGDLDTGPDGRIWHVDHAYPRVYGGDGKRDNLVLSCATCNLSKGKKTANQFGGSDASR